MDTDRKGVVPFLEGSRDANIEFFCFDGIDSKLSCVGLAVGRSKDIEQETTVSTKGDTSAVYMQAL